ncbi:rfaE bifunctional protein [Hydrogenobacter thermophilus TK-6]|uniref:D-glycero-beta-D-manno-heptose 1-phosphate adenylyltransferase n=1 Tax=Hydrogenobacter thermophilus (strain DSM 6534 / IAM 12695 / TK-6) TaxID=608538 RepID=D3DH02_HYDTT|nr:D-glycero-beta-D-manno-heptose 1-phosphate adenylyltransferase [Hydrogenobacter thermophilus]ADO45039.1 rfaE bifunctional protein [Hydrogenobacter thermophilus TK-6]BAI69104.1 glycerol-3-phosphate cytidyltransferase [Hydrogenobacter thermophilus TK-6]
MIIELEELLRVLKEEREKGKRVVFTNGCFDILHAGHAYYLKKARELGDILVVGLNSDASVRRIKGEKRPIMPQEMRAYLLDSLKGVDYVVIFEEDTPERLIELIKPDVLVKGSDWDLKDIVGADMVLSYGGKVERISFEFNISTSAIIERIINAYRC